MPGKRTVWRRILVAVIVFLILIGIAALVLYQAFLTPAAIEKRAIRALAEKTGLILKLKSARYDKGVILVGPAVSEAGASSEQPVISADEVRIKPKMKRLLVGKFDPSEIEIDGLKIRVELDKEAGWPFLRRLQKDVRPSETRQFPNITLSNAAVNIIPAGEGGPIPRLELGGIKALAYKSGAVIHAAATFTDSDIGDWRIEANVDPALPLTDVNMGFNGLKLSQNMLLLVPESVKKNLDDLSCAGLVDGNLNVKLTRGMSNLDVAGDLVLQQGVISHSALPLPLRALQAKVKFRNSNVTVNAFTAKFGDASLSGSGHFESSVDGISYNAEVSASGLSLEPVLVQTLPEDVKNLWKQLDPSGTLDANLKVEKAFDGEPDLRGAITLKDVQLAAKEIPWPITRMRGKVTLQGRTVSVMEPVQAEWAGGAVQLLGVGDFDKETYSAVVKYQGVKVENKIADLLPTDVAQRIPKDILENWISEGTVKTTVDGQASVSIEPGKPVQYTVAAHIPELTFNNPRLSSPASFSADVVFTPEAVTLTSGTASWAGAKAKIEPTTIPFDLTQPFRIGFAISDINLTPELYSYLPPHVQERWDEFTSPTGIMNIEGLVWKDPDTDAIHSHFVSSIRGATAKFSGFPFPLQNMEGRWEVADTYLTDAYLKARTGDTDIEVSVQKAPYRDMAGRRYVIRATNAPMNKDFYDSLPPEFQIYDPAKLAGRFDLGLVIHYIRPIEDTPGWTHFEGIASIPEMQYHSSVPFQMSNALVSIDDASLEQKKITLIGRGGAKDATVEKVVLQNLNVAFSQKKDTILVEPIVADCYGGTITNSYVKVDPSNNSSRHFQGNLNIVNAKAKRIAEDRNLKLISGKMSVETCFYGETGNPDAIGASGKMTIENGEIGELPGFLSPLNLLVFNKWGAGAFNGMLVAYTIKDDTLTADEIQLNGRLISLKGEGKITPEGKLDFHFIPSFGPKLLFPIPIYDEIVAYFKKQLIPINVQGAYNDPVMSINPLLPVTQLIQRTVLGMIPFRKAVEKKETAH